MIYNNTRVQISVPFHEDLFLRSYLSTEMWHLITMNFCLLLE